MKGYLFLFTVTLYAVSCTGTPKEMKTPAVDEEIRQIVSNLYNSIHYDGNEQPDWDYFRSLFIDEAFLIQYGYNLHLYEPRGFY